MQDKRLWLLLLPISITLLAMIWGGFSIQIENKNYTSVPTLTLEPLAVQSSCPNVTQWPTIDSVRVDKNLTINVSMLDGRPLKGLCITALLDNMPFEPIQYVSTCITGNLGQCTFRVPTNLVRLYFGTAIIDGLPLAESLNVIQSYANPSQDGIVYFIGEEETAAISYLVAVPRYEQKEIVLKIAHRTESGLVITRPEVPSWALTTVDNSEN